MPSRLFGPLPTRGIWTAVGLSRGQFLAILTLSVACFAFIGGAVWVHPRGDHFLRIGLSYAVIVPAVAFAMRHERPFPLGRALVAIALIALIKLVVTALLLIALVMR